MFGSPNTSESSEWSTTEEALIASLYSQPLLIVVRPDSSDLSEGSDFFVLFRQIQSLHQAGLRHLEVAWVDHPAWCGFVRNVENGSKIEPKRRRKNEKKIKWHLDVSERLVLDHNMWPKCLNSCLKISFG